MIVDAHVHLNDSKWVPKAFRAGMGRIIAATLAKSTGELGDPNALVKIADQQLDDPTGERLIADMDAAGVDVSVIFTIDYA